MIKDSLVVLSLVALIVYFIASLMAFLFGLGDGHHGPRYACHDPKKRIEYVVFTHALACWLMEEPK